MRLLGSCRASRAGAILVAACLLLPPPSVRAGGNSSDNTAVAKGLEPIEKYISNAWDTLTRSLSDCSTVVDPMLAQASVFYSPADIAMPPSVTAMQEKCHVQGTQLPAVIQH